MNLELTNSQARDILEILNKVSKSGDHYMNSVDLQEVCEKLEFGMEVEK